MKKQTGKYMERKKRKDKKVLKRKGKKKRNKDINRRKKKNNESSKIKANDQIEKCYLNKQSAENKSYVSEATFNY